MPPLTRYCPVCISYNYPKRTVLTFSFWKAKVIIAPSDTAIIASEYLSGLRKLVDYPRTFPVSIIGGFDGWKTQTLQGLSGNSQLSVGITLSPVDKMRIIRMLPIPFFFFFFVQYKLYTPDTVDQRSSYLNVLVQDPPLRRLCQSTPKGVIEQS